MTAGMPRIEVKFLIDANGILHVSAREQRSGKESEIEVQPSYGLTDEQVEGMILESFDNAEEDFRQRQVIEARTGKTVNVLINDRGPYVRGVSLDLSLGAAQAIGHGSIDFAPQVKGLEIPGYDPRGLQTMALGFAVGTRGADHNRSGAYEVDFSEAVDRCNVEPAAAVLAIETEDKAALMDSLILCKFLRGVFNDFFAESAEILRLVTGWDVSAAELRQTAARIVTAKKRFNILAGWSPAEDTLPDRMLRQPLPEDVRAQLSPQRLAALVQAYNRARGWSPEGWLPAEEMGIDDRIRT